MPQVKSSSPSKRNASKAKGSVRAKSGCYTCRIRRKKCDEQPDATGACQTCNRLRLECLGFGAKRPDWLRESRNVSELRERIKGFLAAQGMIKGHSGSGPRGVDREASTLRLNEDYTESSASPPTPTLSLSNDTIRHHHHHHHHHNVSSIRDDLAWMEPAGTATAVGFAHSTSWWLSSSPLYSDDLYSPGLYAASTMRDSSSPSSRGSAHDPPYPVDNSLLPAIASSFSPLYNFSYPDEFILETCEAAAAAQPLVPRNPDIRLLSDVVDRMVQHYVDNVVSVQYLLADDNVRSLICNVVSSHQGSRDAASLLASIHWKRFSHPQMIAFEAEDTQDRLRRLHSLLNSQAVVGSGDAMAALHVISSFLFDGGSGEWQSWLNVTNQYVWQLLYGQYRNPVEALCNCSAKEAFIIKTAIWFDVLASVTTQRSPYLLEPIRALFDPSRSRISGTTTTTTTTDDQTSMMSPMGCKNEVVWALAETSELWAWKQEEIRMCRLSMPALVKRGAAIDEYLSPTSSAAEDYPSADVQGCRTLAADIFRASTRLYLRTVVSGDYSHVPEIVESVEDTMHCMKRLNYSPAAETVVNGQTMSRLVVRNTVFSFFLCGVLTEREEHFKYIEMLLQREGDGAGNCGTIENLLKTLWESKRGWQQHRRSRNSGGDGMDWRGQLTKYNILLV